MCRIFRFVRQLTIELRLFWLASENSAVRDQLISPFFLAVLVGLAFRLYIPYQKQ